MSDQIFAGKTRAFSQTGSISGLVIRIDASGIATLSRWLSDTTGLAKAAYPPCFRQKMDRTLEVRKRQDRSHFCFASLATPFRTRGLTSTAQQGGLMGLIDWHETAGWRIGFGADGWRDWG